MVLPLRSILPSLAALVLTTSACNLGRTVDKMTLKRLAPGMLANDDVGALCASGQALAPPLAALGHGSDGAKEPRKALALTLISSGMCSERAVWEVELEVARWKYVIFEGQYLSMASVLKDLLIKGQRLHKEAAARNLGAYTRVVEVYGAPTEDVACPSRLREKDQLLFLLGMTAGLLATIHDTQAERVVGVSQSIPRRVADGAGCVDNDRWWGLPDALDAAVATAVPGAAKPGVDPWAVLERAAGQGEAAGIWLGRALQLKSAISAGRPEAEIWKIIEAHAAALRRSEGDSDYALLNAYASEMIRFESDVRWIKTIGSRTPIGTLGSRPPQPEPEPEPEPEPITEGEEDALEAALAEDEAPSVDPHADPSAAAAPTDSRTEPKPTAKSETKE